VLVVRLQLDQITLVISGYHQDQIPGGGQRAATFKPGKGRFTRRWGVRLGRRFGSSRHR
jgi:hypothetical protein